MLKVGHSLILLYSLFGSEHPWIDGTFSEYVVRLKCISRSPLVPSQVVFIFIHSSRGGAESKPEVGTSPVVFSCSDRQRIRDSDRKFIALYAARSVFETSPRSLFSYCAAIRGLF